MKQCNYLFLSVLAILALVVDASDDCCFLCFWCWFDEPDPSPTPRPSPRPRPSPTPRPSPRPRRPPTPRPTHRRKPTSPSVISPIDNNDLTEKKLVTTFGGTNGQAGNMFDVVADKDVLIVGMDIHTSSTSEIEVMIWAKRGTFIGYERYASAWELIGLVKVTGKGEGRRTSLPPSSFDPVRISASETRAFYVTLTTYEKGETSMKYSNGQILGKTFASNGDIQILEGAALQYPFGDAWQPRVWNGVLKYELLGESKTDTPSVKPTPRPSLSPTSRPNPQAVPVPSKVSTQFPTSSKSQSISVSPTTLSSSSTFSFYALSDIPYTKNEAEILRSYLEDIPSSHESDDDHPVFIVHLGDMMNARRSQCVQSKFTSISSMFKQYSSLPVLVTPGDNDWNDCPDPSAAWGFWSKNFIDIEKHWAAQSTLPNEVERQLSRPENFAFEINGVLFLGLNLVGDSPEGAISDEDWERRLDQNIEWTDYQLEKYGVASLGDSSNIRGIIVFGHSVRGRRVFDNLYIKLRLSDIPTIFLHGNSREFAIEQTYLDKDWKTFWSVQVDPGAIAPPVKVTVRGKTSPSKKDAFVEENQDQHLFGEFIKLDRRRTIITPTSMPSRLAPAPVAPPSKQTDVNTRPPPAASPIYQPTKLSMIQISSTLHVEIRFVGAEIMSDKEMNLFETNVNSFLGNLFYYTAPPVHNVDCDIEGQKLVPAREMRRLKDTSLEAAKRKAQSDFALQIDLMVSGEFAPTKTHRTAEDVDFAMMVQTFFDVNGGQLAVMLSSLWDQADARYFERITSISAVGRDLDPGETSIQNSTDGEKGRGKILAFTAIIIGCFVFICGLVLTFIYQKRWRGMEYDELGSIKFWLPLRKTQPVEEVVSTSPPPESPAGCREVMPSIDGESDGMGSLSRLELLDAPSCAFSEDGAQSSNISAVTLPNEVLAAFDERTRNTHWRNELIADIAEEDASDSGLLFT